MPARRFSVSVMLFSKSGSVSQSSSSSAIERVRARHTRRVAERRKKSRQNGAPGNRQVHDARYLQFAHGCPPQVHQNTPRQDGASQSAPGGDAAAERAQHRARCNRRRRRRRRCCRRRCHRRRCSRCCRRRRAHGSAKARPANWQPIRWRHSGDHPIPLGEIHQPDGERAAGVPLRPGPHGCATAGRLHAVDNACRLRNAAGTIAAVPCSPARVQKLAPSNDFITSFPCADGACGGCLRRQRRSPWPPFSALGRAWAATHLPLCHFLHSGPGMHLASVPSAGQGPHGAPPLLTPPARPRRRFHLMRRPSLNR